MRLISIGRSNWSKRSQVGYLRHVVAVIILSPVLSYRTIRIIDGSLSSIVFATYFRKYVSNGLSQIPKLSDVAKLAKVGNATVSRALNGGKNVGSEAMERITAAIRELNYQPNRVARSLKGASSGIIGMIVPSISDMFFSKCAEAVEGVVRQHGAVLVVVASHDDDGIVLGSLRQLLLHNVDGLIIAYNKTPERELIGALQAARLPVVGIDGPLTGVGCPSILCENFEGARLATDHLLAHGYSKIISVQVKPDLYTMRERLRGYNDAISRGHAQSIEEVVVDRDSAAAALLRHVPRKGPPVAVFAANNLTARYLYEAVHFLELSIPHQVAVLSFDDFDLADTLTPPMSVVQQPIEDMGRMAAKLLFQPTGARGMQEFPAGDGSILLSPRLVIRQSCGCNLWAGGRARLGRVTGING